MASSMRWHPLLHQRTTKRLRHIGVSDSGGQVVKIRAFRWSDAEGFAKRVASGEVWRGAWRRTNDGLELLVFETRRMASRIDRRYEVSRRLSDAAQSASYRARELDRDFGIRQRWRVFSLDFGTNWLRYKRQISDFLSTPLGRNSATVLFIWFAMSGWLFQALIFATLALPFAGPLLIGAVANNFVIKGECPACKRQFVGFKSQTIQCLGCGNITWKPQGEFFSSGGKTTSSKSQPDVIDVEFEEK